ncbi:hypothetical protein T4E_5322 [Trichinella pseudospiralis]|uniref:Uncharacterized protein n=1 Tax=Trichinella pseudospiralis TaxID=6337 RepID=A0A0V0XNB5_TRIPS|nr:hypothetical protein T4E_5322 [Trichinella pseudospiralis]
MLGDFYNTMFELSLMLNTAGLYWFGVALVWFGLIREGSYELHVIVVKASLYVGNDPAKTKSQLLYTQVAQVIWFAQFEKYAFNEESIIYYISEFNFKYEEGRQEKVKSRSITNDKK